MKTLVDQEQYHPGLCSDMEISQESYGLSELHKPVVDFPRDSKAGLRPLLLSFVKGSSLFPRLTVLVPLI